MRGWKLRLESRRKEAADNERTEGPNSLPRGQREQRAYTISRWSFVISQSQLV